MRAQLHAFATAQHSLIELHWLPKLVLPQLCHRPQCRLIVKYPTVSTPTQSTAWRDTEFRLWFQIFELDHHGKLLLRLTDLKRNRAAVWCQQ